jgi:hypothetical protein
VTEHESPTEDAAAPAGTEPEVDAAGTPAAATGEPHEPDSTEPEGSEPAAPVDEPGGAEPVVDEPVVDEPVVDEPVVDAPVVDEPVVDEPVVDAPVVDAPAQDAEPAATEPAPTYTEPTVSAPTPGPVPTPRVLARPTPRPRPAAPAAAGTPTAVPAPAVPAPADLSPAEAAAAAAFGRVDEDGTVWVRDGETERSVGQYAGDADEALAFYVRRYADLHAKVALAEARVGTDLPAKELEQTLTHLDAELTEPAAVGDLPALRARIAALHTVAAERRAAQDAERAAAKQAAVAARTALVEAAEQLAATDPAAMQWRPAGEQLRTLLDQWKDAQRHGPRIDRPTEDALWRRFSHARSAFDRERRRHFAELEKSNASAKTAKTALVAEAEALATSTDWGATAGAFRDLMTRWKASGRAGRKDDDALWARFRAAQDAFFAARDAQSKQTDAEFAANLEVKLELLTKAEALVPVTDLAAARAALRDLQEAWEAAGKVPRADVQRVEGRLRAVEQAVRDAEQAQWRRTNPETRARAEGAAAQLVSAITQLEAELATAEAKKDARLVAELTSALEARKAWLEQVERAAADAR